MELFCFLFRFSLLMYRNASEFCVLICILSLFISSNTFWNLQGFLHTRLLSVKRSFCLLTSNLDAFISFSFLVPLARTSHNMLNRGGGNGHSWLVPDLRGKDCNLSSLFIMLAVGLLFMVFTMLRHVPSISNMVIFIMKICISSNAFLTLLRWFYGFFIFYPISVVLICISWTILVLRDKSPLMMVYEPFDVLLNSVF